jgi:hypothetical protein
MGVINFMSKLNSKKLRKLGLTQPLIQVEIPKTLLVTRAFGLEDPSEPLPPGAVKYSKFNLINGIYEQYSEIDGRPAYKKTINLPQFAWSSTQYIQYDKDADTWFVIVSTSPDLIIPADVDSIVINKEVLESGSFLPGSSIVLAGSPASSPEFVDTWTPVASNRPIDPSTGPGPTAAPDGGRMITAFNNLQPVFPEFPAEHLKDLYSSYYPTSYTLSLWQNKLEWLPVKEAVTSILLSNSPYYKLDIYADIGGEYVDAGLNTYNNDGSRYWLNNNGCIITYTNVLNSPYNHDKIWEIWTHKNNAPWSPPNVNTENGKLLYYAFAGGYSIPGPGGTIIIEPTDYKPWDLNWLAHPSATGLNPEITPVIKRFVG